MIALYLFTKGAALTLAAQFLAGNDAQVASIAGALSLGASVIVGALEYIGSR